VNLSLPYPPSGNNYKRLRVIGGRPSWYLTPAAKAYHTEVVLRVRTCRDPKPQGRLRVYMTIQAPTARRMDLDNAMKVVLDSLQHAGAIRNDSDIDHLTIVRLPQSKSGGLVVEITEIQ
jgi:Holliday junction resolvase RusA-like endonuclease